MESERLDEDLRLPRQRAGTIDAYPRCPACSRPVRVRADLVTLSDGTVACEAGGIRRALRVHLRRCRGH